jgi:transposase
VIFGRLFAGVAFSVVTDVVSFATTAKSCETVATSSLLGWTAPRRHQVCQIEACHRSQTREPSVGQIIRIGPDTSKNVFQLHGVDESEQPLLRRTLRRRAMLPFFAKLAPTRVGMETCGGSHYWARELRGLGHEVALIPPQYVKPYVDRGKNDAADAEAICEAMSRPKVAKRFVTVKTVEQQASQMLVGVREGLLKRRTQVSNTIRGHAGEFGLVAPRGVSHIEPLIERIFEDQSLPELVRDMFAMLVGQYRHVSAQIREIEARLIEHQRANALSRRLAKVPTIGPVIAAALPAKVPDPKVFRSARDFAAWLGLTPKDHSTGGKTRLGVITRAGDETLRSLLVCGATSVIEQVRHRQAAAPSWLVSLIRRKPPKLAAVALANKTARIAWKMMVTGEAYDPHRHAAPHAAGIA